MLLGPAPSPCVQGLGKAIKIIRFRFFDELKNAIKNELKKKKFDLAIHCAAVSDFKPVSSYKGKIKSGIKSLNLKLIRTEKLVKIFKKIQPKIKLVIFKLELGVSKSILLKRALAAKKEYNADIAVANTFIGSRYKAFILDKEGKIFCANNKALMAKKLVDLI